MPSTVSATNQTESKKVAALILMTIIIIMFLLLLRYSNSNTDFYKMKMLNNEMLENYFTLV